MGHLLRMTPSPICEACEERRNSGRNLNQNAKMWACLADISKQVNWYGNKLTPEEWKEVISAGLKQQKVVPGMDGGFVVIGARTSKMTKKEMSDLLELAIAFGVQHGVKFTAREEEFA